MKFGQHWIPTRVSAVAWDFLDITCSFDDVLHTKTHRDCKGAPSDRILPRAFLD
jgi:hypothetical protein